MKNGTEQVTQVVRTLRIQDKQGLHARPALSLARETRKFTSKVHLILGNRSADATSILDMLLLGAGQGTSLLLQVCGEDAEDAANHLCKTFYSEMLDQRRPSGDRTGPSENRYSTS
jgi:phosphotransferase system HPr (HPr) family protein